MRILEKMVAKSPGKRLVSAAEVARMLEPYCKGSNLEVLYGGYLSGRLEKSLYRPPSRKSLVLALVLIPVVAGLVLVAGSIFWPSKPKSFTTDLLAQIDLNRDRVLGRWVLESRLLQSAEQDEVASLRLPQSMPAEFRLEITTQRKAGVDLMFIHRSQETPFALAFSVKASAAEIGSEAEQTSSENDTLIQKRWAIENFRSPNDRVSRAEEWACHRTRWGDAFRADDLSRSSRSLSRCA